MLATLCGILAIAAQAPAADLDGATFFRTLRAEHARIKSLVFVYEGRQEWVGPGDAPDTGGKPFGEVFEGSFLYRADGAELVDLYKRGSAEDAVVERVQRSALDGKFRQAAVRRGAPPDEVRVMPGDAGMIAGPGSPHPLLHTGTFRAMTKDEEWGFEFRGWEEVDGHRCAAVKLNWAPKYAHWYALYWFDLGRGAHPLKVEEYDDKGILARIDEVALASFPTPGGEPIWLPTQCRVQGFRWGRDTFEEPVVRERLAVLPATVLLNRELPDSLFRIEKPTESALTRRLDRRHAELPLGRAYGLTPPDPAEDANDLASIDARLETMVAEANQQPSERVEATSVARASWSWTSAASYGLIGLGALVLIGVVFLKVRS